MEQTKAHYRRGAPRPVAHLPPPPHLGPAARTAFATARDSRPGYWTASDAVMLTAWALAAARAHELECNPALATRPREYSDILGDLIRIGRALRLTPQARADEESSVPPPSHGASSQDAGNATDFANSPWMRGNGDVEGHA